MIDPAVLVIRTVVIVVFAVKPGERIVRPVWHGEVQNGTVFTQLMNHFSKCGEVVHSGPFTHSGL